MLFRVKKNINELFSLAIHYFQIFWTILQRFGSLKFNSKNGFRTLTLASKAEKSNFYRICSKFF